METPYLFDVETKVWIRNDYINNIIYSDGSEVEQKIFEAVKNCSDVSVLSTELELQIFDWTSLCFFSKRRANLLRPFASLFKGKHILEVGCGAGPITRFLGECGAYVYAVEPSLQRAKIAAERCRDLENVKVFCDDIAHFQSDQLFDGIIQVGVLEYATRYSNESNAALNFLIHLKKFLKNTGFLITAIENQLGLKYFSGFMEDHAGVLMHSINNNYQPGEATTTGRKKLLEMFAKAGFGSNELFLPFPDYKMPSLIFYPGFNEKNENCKVNIESILSNISYQDQQPQTPLFSLDKALPLIAQNDLLYDLSNSFCIFSQPANNNKIDNDILFAFYRTERKKEYCKETFFKLDNETVKVFRNYLEPAARREHIISFDAEEPAWQGTLHHYKLVEIINRNNWRIEQIGGWMTEWLICLKKELTRLYGFTRHDYLNRDLKISSKYIDAIPINLIIRENGFRFIDLEINLNQDIELGYVIFRGIYVSLTRLSSAAAPIERKYTNVENILYALFSWLGYNLNPDKLDQYYEYEGSLTTNISEVSIKTVKGHVQQLRVRLSISEYYESMQHIESLREQLQFKEASVENLDQLIYSLQQQLQFKQTSIEGLDHLVHDLNEQLSSLNKEVEEKQTHIGNLYHEIHSLSTSRKRMVKLFITRTLPFLNSIL